MGIHVYLPVFVVVGDVWCPRQWFSVGACHLENTLAGSWCRRARGFIPDYGLVMYAGYVIRGDLLVEEGFSSSQTATQIFGQVLWCTWYTRLREHRISCHFRSICNFFLTKWLLAAIFDSRKSLLITFLAISDKYVYINFHLLDFCSLNGCRRLYNMPENHIWSDFSPFQINMQLTFFSPNWHEYNFRSHFYFRQNR